MENDEKLDAVRRMQDFIDSHIREPITLHMLARVAGYSPWHSARIFKDVTGRTPFDYIRALRLSRAAVRLRDKTARVVDVAFDFVFGSHEGFTRAFSRQFGISPRDYSRNRPPLKLFMPARLRDDYIILQKGEKIMSEQTNASTVFVQVVDRPARKFIVRWSKKAINYFEYCEEVPCEFWEVLTTVKDALNEPIGAWVPDNLRPSGTGLYAQGVEVPADYSGEVPKSCDIIDLPPCKMMVFQGPPYDDCNFREAIGDLWSVMKDYNPELYGFAWADEGGPRFQLEPQGYRGYIEARPVRQLNVK